MTEDARTEQKNLPGLVIRKRRKELGLSQEEAARRANLSRATVSRTEKAVTEPLAETVAKLAAAVGLTPEDLVVGSAVQEPAEQSVTEMPGNLEKDAEYAHALITTIKYGHPDSMRRLVQLLQKFQADVLIQEYHQKNFQQASSPATDKEH